MRPEPTGPPGAQRSAPGPGRAGRDLPAAIGVGVGLGGLVVGSLVIDKAAFVAVVAVAMLIAVWELSNALGSRAIRTPVVPIGVGTVAMLVAAYNGGAESLVIGLTLTLLGVLVWRLTEGPTGYLRDATAGLFTTVYVPFLAGFAVLLNTPTDGASRVATFVIVTVSSDIGGYATGVLAGRHPMAPSISPKKSWEGFGGSVLACSLAAAVCVVAFFDGTWWEGVVLGVAIAAAATLGDLGESLVKRDLGVKDMGTLLPGHGGLMDRLDSLLIGAPVAWLLLSAFVPVVGS